MKEHETISMAEAVELSGLTEASLGEAARRHAFRSWLVAGGGSGRRRRIHLASFKEWLAERRAKDSQYTRQPARKAT